MCGPNADCKAVAPATGPGRATTRSERQSPIGDRKASDGGIIRAGKQGHICEMEAKEQQGMQANNKHVAEAQWRVRALQTTQGAQ